ncbi:Uncharacterised protein [Enterobacter cloacae]|nr:Uncharacterised protein [Enterobacter cloacae]
MTIVAYAAHKQVDFTVGTDFFFILTAFCVNIRRVSIQQVNVFSRNINVIEEITVHKAVVTFRMFLWQADIFVHVEGHNVFKANLARFVHFNQSFISGQGRAAGWKTENERTIGCWFERVDAVNDMTSSPFSDLFSCCQGNQSHYSPLKFK